MDFLQVLLGNPSTHSSQSARALPGKAVQNGPARWGPSLHGLGVQSAVCFVGRGDGLAARWRESTVANLSCFS